MEFIRVKKLIYKVKNDHQWFGVTHNCNIYRGCSHGCIYCDSRSSCYQISDFDTIKAKEDADKMIELELSKKRKKGVLGLGAMSDPYNPLEKKLEYTRSCLKSCIKHQFGVVIITKSTLVLRDIDLLQELSKTCNVTVMFTVTTSDDRLGLRIERNVEKTSLRIQAIKELRKHNIYTGIIMMPLLPFINDTIENVTNIIDQAHIIDASFIYPSFGVTLRDNQRSYFLNKIGPKLREQYTKEFQESYMCISKNVQQLEQVFKEKCQNYGIIYKMSDIIKQSSNKEQKQMSLF